MDANEVTVSHKAIRSIHTELGMRTFTDVTFEARGEHYGNRYHGALGPVDIDSERRLLARRLSKGLEVVR